jgi:hypothetical protein
MTRLYVIGALLLCVIALILLVAWQSSIVTDLRQERDAATGNIETRERIDNATSGPRDPDSILDRLRDLAK